MSSSLGEPHHDDFVPPRRDRFRILAPILALALIPSTIASVLVLDRLESFLEADARRELGASKASFAASAKTSPS